MTALERKKINFIMHRFRTGGVERMFLNVSRQLPDYDIRLIILNDDMDGIFHEIPSHVEIEAFRSFRMIRALRRFKTGVPAMLASVCILAVQLTLMRFSKQLKANYNVNFSDTLSTLLAAYAGRKKVLSWIHLNPSVIAGSRWAAIYSQVYKRCHAVICVCKDQQKIMLDWLPSLKAGKTQVIFNSIDCAAINSKLSAPKPPESGYLLMVARLDTRSKDFFTLIDAYAALKNETSLSPKLILLGDGPDREVIQTYIDRQALTNEILLPGNMANPYVWMERAGIFIFSSKFEGFGLVLLEALYCGAPIISTNCQVGPREILDDGKYGTLVEVGDRDALKNAMKHLLSSSGERETAISKGKQRAIQFDVIQNGPINKLFMNI